MNKINYVDKLNMFGEEISQIPCLKSKTPPTSETYGVTGMLLMVTSGDNKGDMYKCVSDNNGEYEWIYVISDEYLQKELSKTNNYIMIDTNVADEITGKKPIDDYNKPENIGKLIYAKDENKMYQCVNDGTDNDGKVKSKIQLFSSGSGGTGGGMQSKFSIGEIQTIRKRESGSFKIPVTVENGGAGIIKYSINGNQINDDIIEVTSNGLYYINIDPDDKNCVDDVLNIVITYISNFENQGLISGGGSQSITIYFGTPLEIKTELTLSDGFNIYNKSDYYYRLNIKNKKFEQDQNVTILTEVSDALGIATIHYKFIDKYNNTSNDFTINTSQYNETVLINFDNLEITPSLYDIDIFCTTLAKSGQIYESEHIKRENIFVINDAKDFIMNFNNNSILYDGEKYDVQTNNFQIKTILISNKTKQYDVKMTYNGTEVNTTINSNTQTNFEIDFTKISNGKSVNVIITYSNANDNTDICSTTFTLVNHNTNSFSVIGSNLICYYSAIGGQSKDNLWVPNSKSDDIDIDLKLYNFNFNNNNGFILFDNNSVMKKALFSNGINSYAQLNFNPLFKGSYSNYDPNTTGFTFSIKYKTKETFTNNVVCKCVDGDGRGFIIKENCILFNLNQSIYRSEEISLSTDNDMESMESQAYNTDTLYIDVPYDEFIDVSFVVDKVKNKDRQKITSSKYANYVYSMDENNTNTDGAPFNVASYVIVLYVNGIITRFKYIDTDNLFNAIDSGDNTTYNKIQLFSDIDGVKLSKYCNCGINNIKFYDRALSPNEIIINYISELDESEKTAEYLKNNVGKKESGEYDPNMIGGGTKLNLPIVTLIGANLNILDSKLDESSKNYEYHNVTISIDTGDNKPKYYYGSLVKVQGTSSVNYPIKNYRIVLYNHMDDDGNPLSNITDFEYGTDENIYVNDRYKISDGSYFKSDFYSSSESEKYISDIMYGNPLENKIQIGEKSEKVTSLYKKAKKFPIAITNYINNDTWEKEDTYTLKADYMESSHVRNSGIASYVNDIFLNYGKNIFNSTDTTYNAVKKVAIDGFPCILKYRYLDKNTNKMITVEEGIFNFNLDKNATNNFNYEINDGVKYVKIADDANYVSGEKYYVLDNENYNRIVIAEADFDSKKSELYIKNDVNLNMCKSYELSNNGSTNNETGFGPLFKLVRDDQGRIDKEKSITAIKNAFEIRYHPNEDASIDDNEKLIIDNDPYKNTQFLNLIHYIDDAYRKYYNNVVSPKTKLSETELAKLKSDMRNEFIRHFNLNSVMFYYIMAQVFGMADNLGKNMMLTTWNANDEKVYYFDDNSENSSVDNNIFNDIDYKKSNFCKWHLQFYDIDTNLGLRNDGINTYIPTYDLFGHNITNGDDKLSITYSTDDYNLNPPLDIETDIFNATDSQLWNLFKFLYDDRTNMTKLNIGDMNDVRNYYHKLKNVETKNGSPISVDYIFGVFKTGWFNNIGAYYYNNDMLTKYFGSLYGNSVAYTKISDMPLKCFGSNELHIKQWLTRQIIYLDSKYYYYNDNATDIRPMADSTTNISRYFLVKPIYPLYLTMSEADDTPVVQQLCSSLYYNKYYYNPGHDANGYFCMPKYISEISNFDIYKFDSNLNLGSFKNLTKLNLVGDKSIPSVTIGSKKLKTINISNTVISKLELNDMSELYELNASNSQLSSLNMNNCGALEKLNIENTNITKLNIDYSASSLKSINKYMIEKSTNAKKTFEKFMNTLSTWRLISDNPFVNTTYDTYSDDLSYCNEIYSNMLSELDDDDFSRFIQSTYDKDLQGLFEWNGYNNYKISSTYLPNVIYIKNIKKKLSINIESNIFKAIIIENSPIDNYICDSEFNIVGNKVKYISLRNASPTKINISTPNLEYLLFQHVQTSGTLDLTSCNYLKKLYVVACKNFDTIKINNNITTITDINLLYSIGIQSFKRSDDINNNACDKNNEIDFTDDSVYTNLPESNYKGYLDFSGLSLSSLNIYGLYKFAAIKNINLTVSDFVAYDHESPLFTDIISSKATHINNSNYVGKTCLTIFTNPYSGTPTYGGYIIGYYNNINRVFSILNMITKNCPISGTIIVNGTTINGLFSYRKNWTFNFNSENDDNKLKLICGIDVNGKYLSKLTSLTNAFIGTGVTTDDVKWVLENIGENCGSFDSTFEQCENVVLENLFPENSSSTIFTKKCKNVTTMYRMFANITDTKDIKQKVYITNHTFENMVACTTIAGMFGKAAANRGFNADTYYRDDFVYKDLLYYNTSNPIRSIHIDAFKNMSALIDVTYNNSKITSIFTTSNELVIDFGGQNKTINDLFNFSTKHIMNMKYLFAFCKSLSYKNYGGDNTTNPLIVTAKLINNTIGTYENDTYKNIISVDEINLDYMFIYSNVPVEFGNPGIIKDVASKYISACGMFALHKPMYGRSTKNAVTSMCNDNEALCENYLIYGQRFRNSNNEFKITNASKMFYGSDIYGTFYNIEYITGTGYGYDNNKHIFTKVNNKLTDISYMFHKCENLNQRFDSDKNKNVNSVSIDEYGEPVCDKQYYCELPEDFFSQLNKITTCKYLFYGTKINIDIQKFADKLFADNNVLTDCSYMFSNCSNLTGHLYNNTSNDYEKTKKYIGTYYTDVENMYIDMTNAITDVAISELVNTNDTFDTGDDKLGIYAKFITELINNECIYKKDDNDTYVAIANTDAIIDELNTINSVKYVKIADDAKYNSNEKYYILDNDDYIKSDITEDNFDSEKSELYIKEDVTDDDKKSMLITYFNNNNYAFNTTNLIKAVNKFDANDSIITNKNMFDIINVTVENSYNLQNKITILDSKLYSYYKDIDEKYLDYISEDDKKNYDAIIESVGMLGNCTNLKKCEYMFENCVGIIGYIPANLFRNGKIVSKLSSIAGMFKGCTNLGIEDVITLTKDETYNAITTNSLPYGLFDYLLNCENMDYFVSECHYISNKCDLIYKYTNNPYEAKPKFSGLNYITDVHKQFDEVYCLPKNLFKYNTNLKTAKCMFGYENRDSFAFVLYGLVDINLFRYNTKLTNISGFFKGTNIIGAKNTDISMIINKNITDDKYIIAYDNTYISTFFRNLPTTITDISYCMDGCCGIRYLMNPAIAYKNNKDNFNSNVLPLHINLRLTNATNFIFTYDMNIIMIDGFNKNSAGKYVLVATNSNNYDVGSHKTLSSHCGSTINGESNL